MHVAIIMDGNGRWAAARGLPRVAGHRAGADAVRRTVETAPRLGIDTLTLYAFSSDNWQRPRAEVSALMRLFVTYLEREARELAENGVRLSVIGRRDRLPHDVQRAVERGEAWTAGGERLHLRVAVDYSARDAIVAAAARLSPLDASREAFAREMGRVCRGGPARDVDLLIRTGGEQRLSDFLLWECAYAELLFLPQMWPDFDGEALAAAVRDFASRERRFGRVPGVPADAEAEPVWLPDLPAEPVPAGWGAADIAQPNGHR